MRGYRARYLKWALAAVVGCFLVFTFSGEAQALVTGQVHGTVVDADGNPVGGFSVKFTPTEGSNSSISRDVKIKKNGTFKVLFFPTGQYKVTSLDPELFLKHIKMTVKDPTGRTVDSTEGDVHPAEGLLTVVVSGGLKVYVDLVAVSGEEKQKLAQQFSLQSASGDLKVTLKMVENKQYDQALSKLDGILEKKPDLGAAHYLRGQTLLRMERYEEAVEEYRTTMELDKEQPGVPANLAMALLQQAEQQAESGNEEGTADLYREAVGMFDVAVEETPDNMAILTSRAAALDRLGDNERLAEALRGILALDPDQVQVRLRLADILTKSGNGEEALALMEELDSDDPVVASTLFNVAVKFYNDGELETAVMTVEKALQVNPYMAAGYRLLGRAKMSLGEKEGAVQALEKFLELAPGDPSAETERKLIEALKAG